MAIKVFGADYFSGLMVEAGASPRKRQHRNVHSSFADPCQRLFNAIDVGSYIRPHRHATDQKDELLIAIRGTMALLTFDDQGNVTATHGLSVGANTSTLASAVQVHANTWHTVVALESCSVLLEVKAGPFDPQQPKDPASWAPPEGAPAAIAYLDDLRAIAEASVLS